MPVLLGQNVDFDEKLVTPRGRELKSPINWPVDAGFIDKTENSKNPPKKTSNFVDLLAHLPS